MHFLKRLLKIALQFAWLIKFRTQTYFLPRFIRRSKKIHAFNLDLHVSVISDVSDLLASAGFRIVRWSISSHNFVFRRFFRIPDPVEFINQTKWRDLNPRNIESFNKKYPNGVLNKDLNIDIMKKLRWKHKISLNRGLDIILRELKI